MAWRDHCSTFLKRLFCPTESQRNHERSTLRTVEIRQIGGTMAAAIRIRVKISLEENPLDRSPIGLSK